MQLYRNNQVFSLVNREDFASDGRNHMGINDPEKKASLSSNQSQHLRLSHTSTSSAFALCFYMVEVSASSYT